MRISYLLQREPFGEILGQTLKPFLDEQFGGDHLVRWQVGRPPAAGKASGREWLCNKYLNAIFLPCARRSALQPVINEFSRSTRAWRRPLQWLYVRLATSHRFSRWLADGALQVSPALPHGEEMLLVGGNHRLRLIDHHAKQCFVLGKSGFPGRWMGNELRVRRAHPFLPVPELREVRTGSHWYREDLLVGTPVNRLKDRTQAEAARKELARALWRLQSETAESTDAASYARRLAAEAAELLRGNDLLDKRGKTDLLAALRILADGVGELHRGGASTVTLCQGHGDFQDGNMLVDGAGRCWLIDWEYSWPRQTGYDGLVFALGSRSVRGLAERMLCALRGEGEASELMAAWPGVNWQDDCYRRMSLCLFLLEEAVLKLLENDNSLFRQPGLGLRELLEELLQSAPQLGTTRGPI